MTSCQLFPSVLCFILASLSGCAETARPRASSAPVSTTPARPVESNTNTAITLELTSSGLLINKALALPGDWQRDPNPPSVEEVARTVDARLAQKRPKQTACNITFPSPLRSSTAVAFLEGAAKGGCADLGLDHAGSPIPLQVLLATEPRSLVGDELGIFFEFDPRQITCRKIKAPDTPQKEYSFEGSTITLAPTADWQTISKECATSSNAPARVVLEPRDGADVAILVRILDASHQTSKRPLHIAFQQPKVSETLTTESIQETVRRSFDVFRSCYDKGRARNPKLAGTVLVHATVAKDGVVSEATLQTSKKDGPLSQMSNQQVAGCVISEFRKLRFPAAAKAISFDYPFVFAPDA